MTIYLAVALGGALGALARYLVSASLAFVTVGGIPIGIITVNVLGSFLMGVLVAILTNVWAPPEEIRSMLTVGLLGGFTTFSVFSLDVVMLVDRGRIDLAALYAVASVVLSVGALFVGLRLVRAVL